MSEVKKGLLEKIKALFSEPAIIAPIVLAAPMPFKLKDGTEIMITMAGEELAIGDMVSVEGSTITAGDLELEDGTVLAIDGMGMITTITPVGPVTTEVEQATAPTVEERLASLEAKISALTTAPAAMATEAQLAEVSGALKLAQAEITKQTGIIAKCMEFMEIEVNAPTVDPVTLTGLKKDRFDKITAQGDRISRMAEARKTLKNQTLN